MRVINTIKNNSGGALGIILIGVFFIVLLVNCYILMVRFNLTSEEKLIIKWQIENSYSQSMDMYSNDFDNFCKIRDFINPEYQPENTCVIMPSSASTTSSGILFNIDEVSNNSKVPLNSKPLTVSETMATISCYTSNDIYLNDQINIYLKSNPNYYLVFYKYKNSTKTILIQNVLSLTNDNSNGNGVNKNNGYIKRYYRHLRNNVDTNTTQGSNN